MINNKRLFKNDIYAFSCVIIFSVTKIPYSIICIKKCSYLYEQSIHDGFVSLILNSDSDPKIGAPKPQHSQVIRQDLKSQDKTQELTRTKKCKRSGISGFSATFDIKGRHYVRRRRP